jgi:hypothetical protein
MVLHREHELHKRRLSLNVGVGLALVSLAALIFGITVVKIANGSLMEAYDHKPRATVLPVTESMQ